MLPYRDSRIIRTTLLAFFLLLLVYGYYETRNVFFGPELTLPEEMITAYEPYATISGRAERISELRLNGTQIPVTESGAFSEVYGLAEGSNRLIFEARDARGRTTRKTVDIVYIPPATQEQ